MIRNKIAKYEEIKLYPNYRESLLITREPLILASYCRDMNYRPGAPKILELGCGKGEHTIDQAVMNPEADCTGIDIKGARLWTGLKNAAEKGLANAFFLRMQIDHIDAFFPEHSIREIWIPFPDPRSKQPGKNEKHRLVSPVFLERYRKILEPGGVIHLKTDHDGLYEYALDVIKNAGCRILKQTDDLYGSGFSGPASRVQTTFEKRYLAEGIRIKYICFTF